MRTYPLNLFPSLLSGIGILINVVLFPLAGIGQEVPSELRQGIPYSEAREILLDEGWQVPYRNPNTNGELMGLMDIMVNEWGYDEFEECSGTGVGFCLGGLFDAYGRKLSVVTVNNEEDPTLYRWWIEEERE